MFEDRAGNFWIGTEEGGLNLMKDDQVVAHPFKDMLANRIVRAIHEDRMGRLWIGTESGLFHLEGGRIKAYGVKDGLPHTQIYSIHEDPGGRIWLGTNGGGLIAYENHKFTSYMAEDDHPLKRVRAVYGDRHGNIWLGSSRDSGVVRFKDGIFNSYTRDHGFPEAKVLSFYEDHAGRLWMCTGDGLIGFVNNRFIDASEALKSGGAFHILEDAQGDMWLDSVEGLIRIAKKDLDDFIEGRTNRIAHELFTTAMNLNPRDFTSGAQGGAWKTRDGRLWFPTRVGALAIDPHNIRRNTIAPPVYVEQVIIDKREVDAEQPTRQPHGDGEIEIHYTALSFAAPEDVHFKYKLEGHDAAWVEADTRRVAYYTNIPPGDYRFIVIASNNHGVWNEIGDTVVFKLTPHFYQTYWFYTLCLMTTALIGWGIYRLRVKQMEAQYARMMTERIAERTRIAREIHDTLIQGVVATSAQLEAMSAVFFDSPQTAKSQLDRVRLMVRQSLDEARRSIWELRPHALDTGDLATALTAIVEQASDDLKTSVHVTGAPQPLSGIVETNLLRIAQEAITNATKHAQANSIIVELEFASGHVRLSVADDGCGFDVRAQSPTSEHFGLLGMQERAQQIGTQLIINSAPGSGTEVVVRVPIQHSQRT